ncbi:MAG: hypothetical protein ACJ8FY_01140 [Gemmataceae bacterium]
MNSRLSFNLTGLVVVIVGFSGLLMPRSIFAQQQAQINKNQAQPETQSKDEEESDPLKEMVKAYPALFKAIPLTKRDDELRKLQIERFEAAKEQVRSLYLMIVVGSAPGAGQAAVVFHLEPTRQLLDSRLDLVENPEDEIAVREDFLKIAKENEKISKRNLETGRSNVAEVAKMRYARADAEIQLLKAKRRLKK